MGAFVRRAMRSLAERARLLMRHSSLLGSTALRATRSKLGAAISRARQTQYELLPDEGDTCLYLGAGHGTSISHLHDHVCGGENEKGGRIIAVDLSPRCLRDLVHLATLRPGLVPVLGDARKQSAWGVMVANKVDWLLQDVSQAGQADIFIKAVKRFLKDGGKGLLSLKAASERFSDKGERAVFSDVALQLTEVLKKILKGLKFLSIF